MVHLLVAHRRHKGKWKVGIQKTNLILGVWRSWEIFRKARSQKVANYSLISLIQPCFEQEWCGHQMNQLLYRLVRHMLANYIDRWQVEKSLLWENIGFMAAIGFGLRYGRQIQCKKYSSLYTSCVQTRISLVHTLKIMDLSLKLYSNFKIVEIEKNPT